ncbi:hypothetical protein NOI20_14435 [Rhodobacteraceae bacterium 10Alg 79]|uniref:Uncharacterized protein n=1 Tax=Rhodalgimonas zhirmunskyi TaxID=2964767 RepID=A0AAJ1UD44_9RHOB|nr:hypothetical protein [Rhodoalgimonas zhirmunskyi]
MDAVRLLPILGGALFLVPLLWGGGETASAAALHYIFGVWIVLIVLAGLLSRAVRRAGWRDPAAPDRGPR